MYGRICTNSEEEYKPVFTPRTNKESAFHIGQLSLSHKMKKKKKVLSAVCNGQVWTTEKIKKSRHDTNWHFESIARTLDIGNPYKVYNGLSRRPDNM